MNCLIEMGFNKRKNINLLFHRLYKIAEEKTNFEDVHIDLFKFTLDSILDYNKSSSENKFDYTITFDDGSLSDYVYAFKELKKRNMNAYFFVVPKFVNNKNYMSWDMILEMSNAGMVIGSHSMSHINLASLSKKDAILELVRSKNIIEESINQKIDSFSFPFGFFNSSLVSEAKKAGYKRIFSSKHGLSSNFENVRARNSINSTFNSNDIKLTLEARVQKKIMWFLEDSIKYPIKNYLGDSYYKYLRSLYKK